jgi:hypothetical protein
MLPTRPPVAPRLFGNLTERGRRSSASPRASQPTRRSRTRRHSGRSGRATYQARLDLPRARGEAAGQLTRRARTSHALGAKLAAPHKGALESPKRLGRSGGATYEARSASRVDRNGMETSCPFCGVARQAGARVAGTAGGALAIARASHPSEDHVIVPTTGCRRTVPEHVLVPESGNQGAARTSQRSVPWSPPRRGQQRSRRHDLRRRRRRCSPVDSLTSAAPSRVRPTSPRSALAIVLVKAEQLDAPTTPGERATLSVDGFTSAAPSRVRPTSPRSALAIVCGEVKEEISGRPKQPCLPRPQVAPCPCNEEGVAGRAAPGSGDLDTLRGLGHGARGRTS